MEVNDKPIFPKWKSVSLFSRGSIETITLQFPPYSDFNFVSLWSYNTEDDAEYTFLNDNLVLRMRDYITNEAFYTFLGTTQLATTIETLLTHAKKMGITQYLQLIPESVITRLSDTNSFLVQEDRDNFDYILSVPEIQTLSGGKYHTHKNHVNRFDRLYPEYRFEVLSLERPDVIEGVFDIFDRWRIGRKKTDEEASIELTALKRLLHHHTHFSLLPIGLYIAEKFVAFSLIELLPSSYAQVHFTKSDPSYTELYYKLNTFSASELAKRGYEYMNIEQDLGIPGLRFAKEQWNPVQMLKKYTIRRNS